MTGLAEIEDDLAPETLRQLRAVPIETGRPLIAVDVDEVLVVFVDHLSRWMRTIGYEMRLVTYQLEGSMFSAGSDDPLPFDQCIALIRRFFDEEVHNQQAIPGGADAAKGKSLYHKAAKPMACKMCHGEKGDGGGKLGKALKPKPRNFTCAETMKAPRPRSGGVNPAAD